MWESLKRGKVGGSLSTPSEVLEGGGDSVCRQFERPHYPAVEVGLKVGEVERGLLQMVTVNYTAKILVLVLGLLGQEGQYFGRQS